MTSYKKTFLFLLLSGVMFLFSGCVSAGKTSAVPPIPETGNRICILGSCSGTEPIPGRHHTAWLLQCGDRLYQFDAGEGCAYTAHTMGWDLTRLHAVFISHPHIDHNGGLPLLISVRNKMVSKWKKKLAVRPLPIYTPTPSQIAALQDFWTAATLNRYDYSRGKNFIPEQVTDGKVFDDGTIRVDAIHNKHCGIPADGIWRAFSYRITLNGKKIVYSGDIRNLEEMAPFLQDCDLLLMENGHHKPWLIAEQIRNTPSWKIKKLVFLHHGRSVLNEPEQTAEKTRKAWGSSVGFARDKMIIEL